MRGSMREEGVLVEDSNEDRVEEGMPPSDSDQYTLAQSNSTLRNQPNSPSSSLTPLSSSASSPRSASTRSPRPRPSPSTASKSQHQTEMSLSPRSNSVYDESPDTTLSSSAYKISRGGRSDGRVRSRNGSEEMELDYDESEGEMEIRCSKEDSAIGRARSLRSASDTGKGRSESNSPRPRQPPSSYIASPWQRRQRSSPPRPRSPSPHPTRRNEPSLPPLSPPASSSHNPRFLPPARPPQPSSSTPPLIRLHLCLPTNLPSSTFTNYLNSLSPPLEIYEQRLSTSQRAAMGFIVVERDLWESGEIERRIRRRGEMNFGIGGMRSWGIKLSEARDQYMSSDLKSMNDARRDQSRADSPYSRHSPSAYLDSSQYRRRSLSPPRHRNPSQITSERYEPFPTLSHPVSTSSCFLPPARNSFSSTTQPQLIKLYLSLPPHLPDSALLSYFSTLSPPLTLHSHSLHTYRTPAFGFILVSRELWENGEINRRIRKKGGIPLERGGSEWAVRLTVARDQIDRTSAAEQVRGFEEWQDGPRFAERGEGNEIVGLVFEGFGRNTRVGDVEGMLKGTLMYWESLTLEDVGEMVRVRLEVRGEKAAKIIERDFEGISVGDRRIRVRRVKTGESRFVGVASERRDEREAETMKVRLRSVDEDETRRRSNKRGRSPFRSRERDSNRVQGSTRSTRRSEEEEDEAEQDARIRTRKRSERKRSHSPSPRRYSPSPTRHSRTSRHSRHSTKTRKRLPSPGSPPRQSSPDPAQPDPRRWRENTPILRSPQASRVPLPRQPTPDHARTSSSRSFETSHNRAPSPSSPAFTLSNRPQLFQPVAERAPEYHSTSSRVSRGEDRWARNGWNQVGREQIAREVREREKGWNRNDEW